MTMKDSDFIRKLLIAIGIGVLVFILWQLTSVLMLAFGSILVAVVLSTFAHVLSKYAHVPERWSLALASVIILGILAGVFFLFGSQMQAQIANVIERLPQALNSLAQRLGIENMKDALPDLDLQQGGTILMRVLGLGGSIFGVLANFFFILIAGVYIAASPNLYRTGLVKLFPPSQHERIESALDASGEALRLWLVSQLIAMTCVGVLSGLAFWLIGVPSPIALGLIAGLLDFIPYLGPFLGAVPAVLVAASVDMETMFWAIGAMFVIQQIEGNIIQPIVGKRMISVPPALALFAILAGSALLGAFGTIFGYPLSIVVYVLVKKLYVRETLGEDTPIPGEDSAKKA